MVLRLRDAFFLEVIFFSHTKVAKAIAGNNMIHLKEASVAKTFRATDRKEEGKKLNNN